MSDDKEYIKESDLLHLLQVELEPIPWLHDSRVGDRKSVTPEREEFSQWLERDGLKEEK